MAKRNILVYVSSVSPEGNTSRLADAFIDGARAAGNRVHRFFPGKAAVEGCRGCGACQKNGNQCVINDCMQEAYPLIRSSDTIVAASPLYFWTFSARAKAFMDRMYALSVNDIYPSKDTFFLMTADSDTENTFSYAADYYHFITDALGWRNIGTYFAGGCSVAAGNHRIPQEHLEKAYQAGFNLPDL